MQSINPWRLAYLHFLPACIPRHNTPAAKRILNANIRRRGKTANRRVSTERREDVEELAEGGETLYLVIMLNHGGGVGLSGGVEQE
jgi:hypothetical protein